MKKRNLLLFLSTFVIFLDITSSYGQQDIKFKHYSIENGLSQASCMSMIMDNKGFIWIGTEDGLNRFDGYTFKMFRNDPEDSTSLSDNLIRSLVEDRDGNIWIGTNAGGLNLFDPKTESFRHFRNRNNDLESLTSNSIWTMLEDSRGNLWIGTYKGLDLFDYQSLKFKHFNHDENDPNSISGDKIQSLFEDSDGRLWIGTRGNGLNLFDYNSQTFSHFEYSENGSVPEKQNIIRSISEDSRGNLWVGTERGLKLFDRNKKDYSDTESYLGEGRITSIKEDNRGNLWVGSWFGGLHLFDYDTQTFSNYAYSDSDITSISGNRIMNMMEDNLGNLWVGTYGNGLNYFDHQNLSFGHKKHSQNDPNSLNYDFVRSFFEEKNGNLWVGTSGGGLDYFNSQNQSVRHYMHSESNPLSIGSNVIRSLVQDKKGNLWIGTNGDGLDVFDISGQSFKHFKPNEKESSSISSDMIYSLYEDHSGTIWIGTARGGLNKYNTLTQSFEHFIPSDDDPSSLGNITIWCTLEDSKGNILVGTWGGLDIFDSKKGTFRHFVNSKENDSSLSHNFVKSICEDSKGRLWVGTAGGLNLFDQASGSFKRYGKKEGLSNEVIYGILEDETGKLWMSTNSGINRFDPDSETFTWYTVEDGLQGNEFSTGASHKGYSGKFYFGGTNGFNAFYPKDIKENTFIPPVILTELLLFNKPISVNDTTALNQSINEIEEIVLNHDDFIFGFEFSALNYRQPEKNQFAYKLDGFDKDWTYTDYKYRRATYTNIPAGKYVFRVKASNDDGFWNVEGKSIHVIILPPWWQTWWAYSLWIILVVGGLLLFYYIRISILNRQKSELEQQIGVRTSEIKRQNEKLEELNREKDGMINIVAHDLNSPLNNIKGFMQLIPKVGELNQEQKEYLEIVDSIIKRGSNLIRNLLDVHAFEYKDAKLETEKVTLDEVIPAWFEGYQQELARKEQIFHPNLKKGDLKVTTSKHLLLRILDNILTNAIKFSEKGKNIYFEVWNENKTVKFSIRDEGPGIGEKDQKKLFKKFQKLSARPTGGESSTGLGMAIIKELANKLGGEIEVQSSLGDGTTMILTLPQSNF